VSSLVEFLSDLRAGGVILSAEGDRLLCNAPKGAMTEEMRRTIATRKPEILEFLRNSAGAVPPRQSDPNNTSALSRSQQRLWFVSQMDPGNPVYNVVIALNLHGPLHQDAMERSLRALVDRHESLRTSFHQQEGKPWSKVSQRVEWRCSVVDLSAHPPSLAAEEARRLALEESRRGFDLASVPLFRATLYRVSADEHLLLLVVHHIVADGWSLGLIAKDLGALYAAGVAGKPPVLAELPATYRDYVQWEEQDVVRATREQLPFWTEQLKGALPILEIPGDRQRPALQTFRGQRIAVRIEPELAQQIADLCRTTGSTSFMVLLAGFAVLLHQYTDLDDILVGSATSNRQRKEFAPIVGFFVNNLVLRTHLGGNPSFSELLQRVRKTAHDAYAHQEIPFDLLVEKLQPQRRTGHSPLVQVFFTLQNLPLEAIELAGLRAVPVQLDPGIARADLAVEIWPEANGYRCDFEYNTDLYNDETMAAMQAQYVRLLHEAVERPDTPIRQLSLLSDEESHQLLIRRRRTDSPAPNSLNGSPIETARAVELTRRASAGSGAVRADIRPGEHPLSRSQQRLWFLDQLDPGNPVYNIAIAIRMDGPLNRAAFEDSLRFILRRHESLRTRFIERDGVPVAVIDDGQNWTLDFVDVSAVASSKQDETILELVSKESQRLYFLDKGPVFRVTLYRKNDQEHVALIGMHHIVSDGWSLGVLSQELGRVYQAYVRHETPPLPPLPLQFREFVQWEHDQQQQSSADLEYWRSKLSGELPQLALPLDHPRPPVQTFRGHRATAEISAALENELHVLARRHNATFYMVLIAGFGVLLRQFTRQDDILIGTPTAGRPKTSFESLIGFFVNNLVLRADMSGDPSFTELVDRIRCLSLEAFEHQSTPFDQLVELLQPERTLDRSPLFQVMFTLQNQDASLPPMGDIAISQLDFQGFRARYDLAVDVYPHEGRFRCDFEYNTDLFEEVTMQRMLRQYFHILELACADATQPIHTLQRLAEPDRHQLIETWNQTAVPRVPWPTVPAWFAAQVQATPTSIAVSMGDHSLTYAELDARSSGLASALRGQGIGRSNVVAVFLERSPEMIIGVLGILKAGAAYLPLDPALPAQRIDFLLADANVPLILTQRELLNTLPATGATVLAVEDVDLLTTDDLSAQPAGDDLAYLIYTSGSTGNPKGTEIPHRALVNLLASMLREPGLSATDTLVSVTTLSFDIATLEVFGPLLCGAKLVIASRDQVIDPEQLADLLDMSDATVMQATPSTWRMLIESGWMGRPRLRMWCGGEALAPDVAEALMARGSELWNLYGPTETTIWSAAHRVRSGENPVLIGRPIANTQMYILDENFQPVPVGVSGELFIAGDGVARGYRGRPELTASRFLSDPFDSAGARRMYRTGDLARYLPDGQIQLLGRTDHQIKLRGHRIEPGEIESAIERNPSVRQAVVVLDGQGTGKQLIAYIRYAEVSGDVEQIRSWLRERLPDYMVPAVLMPLDEFPLTPNGKIDRKRLPSPLTVARETRNDSIAARNQTEQRLTELWSEALHVDRPGVRDNFFDLGGHSLLLVQIHARLKREFNSNLAVVDLFRYPTIEALASFLDRSVAAVSSSPVLR
jgi:amino acid adenylation domain-containing protein